MAQRWTMAEDRIIYKYCVDNRWAFSSDDEIELMKLLLAEAGFSHRSSLAIRKRAREYDSLIAGWYSPYTTNQIRERYEIFTGAYYRNHYSELQAFINQKNQHKMPTRQLDLFI